MVNRESSEQQLSWRREEPIAVPSVEREVRMAIRKADWVRIKRLLETFPAETNVLPIVYSILFGIAGSTGVSIIPLSYSSGLPPWVVPLYACVFVFSLMSGFVFIWVDKYFLKKMRRDHLQMIRKDLEEIESAFHAASPSGQEPSTRT